VNWFEPPEGASLVTSLIAAYFLGRYYVRRYKKIPDKVLSWKIALLSNITVIVINLFLFLIYFNGDLSPIVLAATNFGVVNFVLLAGFLILFLLAVQTVIVRYVFEKSAKRSAEEKKKKTKAKNKAKNKAKKKKTKKPPPKRGTAASRKVAKGK
jgi:hypothetical protein